MKHSAIHDRNGRFSQLRNRLALMLAAAVLPLAATATAATVTAPLTTKTLTTPTLTPTVPLVIAKPDLAIKSIATNAGCQIVVTVGNNGPGSVPDAVWTTKSAASSGVNLTINGAAASGGAIWSFDPGKSLKPSGGNATYTSASTVKGTATVMAAVDQTGQVAEGNEGNNSMTTSLTCGSLAILPGAIGTPTAKTPVISPAVTPTVTPPVGSTVKPGVTPVLIPGVIPSGSSGGTSGGKTLTPIKPVLPGLGTGGKIGGGLGGITPSPGGDAGGEAMPPDPLGYDPSLTGGGMPMTAAGGGTSALAAPLPAPPQNVPPAPPKDSKVIEPAELAVVSANLAEAQQLAAAAQAMGLTVKRRSNLGGLGLVVTVFRVPRDVGVGNALIKLRQAMPGAWADANHRFNLQGDDNRAYASRLIGWQNNPNCGAGFRIGLIDTPIDVDHPQFRGRRIQARGFLPGGVNPAPKEHGTAVASLLVGQESGLVPAAQLYAANVFRGFDRASETTAEWIAQALNWMVENQVAVINLSFGGPRNLLVEAAVQRVLERGIAVVAAAGNGGADAPPVYPAAQPGVVAVTAVDANLAPYRGANRGEYIALAAPGVDVWAAAPGGNGAFISGTSYAAPYVTAALVSSRTNARTPWDKVVHQLETTARDLGDKGRDATFGWGLIQATGCAARPRR